MAAREIPGPREPRILLCWEFSDCALHQLEMLALRQQLAMVTYRDKVADDVHAAMNLLPALVKSSPHAIGRRRCHCNENEKGSKADRNEGPFENVLFYSGKKQALIEYEPGQEMHQDIKERE